MTKLSECVIIRLAEQNIGASPSGKASDSDSDITGVRIPVPQPTKNALLSTDKGAFFELSVPLARNVKYASQVKRTSCVKCAFGTICGTLNFTASKEQLHYAAGHNFTAACRNFTFDDIQGYALIYWRKCGIMIKKEG